MNIDPIKPPYTSFGIQINGANNGVNNIEGTEFFADTQLLELVHKGISFTEIDQDKDGVVTSKNFSDFLRAHGADVHDDNQFLQELYSKVFGTGLKVSTLDANGDGKLTLDELNKAGEKNNISFWCNEITTLPPVKPGVDPNTPTIVGPPAKPSGPSDGIKPVPGSGANWKPPGPSRG